MKNRINFITGENYTLSELFSGEGKIIIPDLQRDYCWGDEVHTKNKIELVSDFTINLMQSFEQEQGNKLNLGLIYGYEALANQIQLCDGQQRITTLYLLIGMLNKKTQDNPFRQLLISDYEYLKDDKEPYLQYAIRESSLYFLSDLVCHFFIEEENDTENVKYAENIKKAQWFFNDYNDDASIQSMIRALSKMEAILEDKTSEWCYDFGKFLTTQLTFMYYDMGSRKNGEETFVVINTTGEPLTATQNLKPLVIHAEINKGYKRDDADEHTATIAGDWESIETWFWNNRRNGNDTAEAGFNEFLRWVTMLYSDKETLQQILNQQSAQFPYNKISFEKVYECWKVTQYLFDEWKNEIYPKKEFLSPKDNEKSIGQIDCFRLLPLMAYCIQWKVTNAQDRNLLRWYNFLHNLARKSDVSKAVNDLVYSAIEMVRNYKDVLELLDNHKNLKLSETILTAEEIQKLTILKENIDSREEIEEAFWTAQNRHQVKSHHIWAGQIKPLIDWASDENGFQLDAFKGYLNMFDRIFEGNCEGNIDLVRRALVTRSLENYPNIVVYGNGFDIEFGWRWYEWHSLIWSNSEAFKMFFDDCIKNEGGNLKGYLQSLCDKFPPEQKWAEYVLHPYLLEYCNTKHVICYDGENHKLVKNSWSKPFNIKNAHLLYSLGATWQNSNIVFDEKYPQWKIWYYPGQDGDCVVLENTEKDITIDIICTITECTVNLFRRKTNEENVKEYFSTLCSTPEWEWNGKRWKKIIDYKLDNEKVRDALNELIGRIEQMN